MWERAGRVVRVAVAAAAVRARVPGHRHALGAGRLHGESAQVHREGSRADRQTHVSVYLLLVSIIKHIAVLILNLYGCFTILNAYKIFSLDFSYYVKNFNVLL